MSKTVYTYEVDGIYGAIGTRLDLDGTTPKVVLCPDRCRDEYRVEFLLTPTVARKVARALNKAAKAVSA